MKFTFQQRGLFSTCRRAATWQRRGGPTQWLFKSGRLGVCGARLVIESPAPHLFCNSTGRTWACMAGFRDIRNSSGAERGNKFCSPSWTIFPQFPSVVCVTVHCILEVGHSNSDQPMYWWVSTWNWFGDTPYKSCWTLYLSNAMLSKSTFIMLHEKRTLKFYLFFFCKGNVLLSDHYQYKSSYFIFLPENCTDSQIVLDLLATGNWQLLQILHSCIFIVTWHEFYYPLERYAVQCSDLCNIQQCVHNFRTSTVFDFVSRKLENVRIEDMKDCTVWLYM